LRSDLQSLLIRLSVLSKKVVAISTSDMTPAVSMSWASMEAKLDMAVSSGAGGCEEENGASSVSRQFRT
jgi:hypothetical protein